MNEPLAQSIFPSVPHRRGHYESYYIRAVAPDRPAAVWIRYTIHKRPHQQARGSLWCTLWDGEEPRAVKETLSTLPWGRRDPEWIEIGQSRLGPGHAVGHAAAQGRSSSWELRFDEGAGAVQHLPMRWLYRSPLPRTKTASPRSDARFAGWVELEGARIEVDGWRGAVGHNWGREHAERWIWLHAVDFADAPEAWLDCVLGRLRLAGRTTPWLANGVLALGDGTVRMGGVARLRDTRVREAPLGAALELAAGSGRAQVEVASPPNQTVAWVYGDPGGGERRALHCSVARLEITLQRPSLHLETAHGACYELGTPESGHGVPLQPFADP